MKQQIVYLMSGPAHTPYLTTSLFSLREKANWRGDILVYAWPESFPIVQQIAEDPRLKINVVERTPSYRGKNAQFLDKIKLMQTIEAETALYLDADTMPVGNLQPLFERLQEHSFVATQFNDWITNQGLVRKRIRQLLGRDEIYQPAVQECLSHPFPSVNGGVFCCRPSSVVLKQWESWTRAVIDLFIADEVILHILFPCFKSSRLMGVEMSDGHFNSSPKFKSRRLNDDDVVIWHFHGDSNVRPSKSQKGVDLWWPVYQECLRDDIGGIRSWVENCGNKYLSRLEREIRENAILDERRSVSKTTG